MCVVQAMLHIKDIGIMGGEPGCGCDTYIGFDTGVPLLNSCGVGHCLATDYVDKGQANGGAKASVELLVDLLLIPHNEESACCCEAHDAGPHNNQQQPLQECQVSHL